MCYNNISPIISGLQLAQALTQQELNYIGNNLDVKVKITDNLKYDGKRHTMILSLSNSGNQAINLRDVVMYFHSFFMIEPDHLPAPEGYHSRKYNIKLKHENGMLFSMDFLPMFGIILPNQSKEIQLNVQDWAVSKTDVINNWYLASNGLNPATVASTAVNDLSFVEEFVDPNQYKRYRNDQYSPFSPVERFSKIKGDDLGPEAVRFSVLPTPKEMTLDTARPIKIDKSWVISAAPSLISEATFLSGKRKWVYMYTWTFSRSSIKQRKARYVLNVYMLMWCVQMH